MHFLEILRDRALFLIINARLLIKTYKKFFHTVYIPCMLQQIDSDSHLDDFNFFFGGNPLGSYLVNAMFKGTDYTKKNNENKFIKALFSAKNYKDFKKIQCCNSGVEQEPDDVPWHILKGVIDAAMFHKSIDNPTVGGLNLQKKITAMKKNMKELLDSPVPDSVITAVHNTFREYAVGGLIDRTYLSGKTHARLIYTVLCVIAIEKMAKQQNGGMGSKQHRNMGSKQHGGGISDDIDTFVNRLLTDPLATQYKSAFKETLNKEFPSVNSLKDLPEVQRVVEQYKKNKVDELKADKDVRRATKTQKIKEITDNVAETKKTLDDTKTTVAGIVSEQDGIAAALAKINESQKAILDRHPEVTYEQRMQVYQNLHDTYKSDASELTLKYKEMQAIETELKNELRELNAQKTEMTLRNDKLRTECETLQDKLNQYIMDSGGDHETRNDNIKSRQIKINECTEGAKNINNQLEELEEIIVKIRADIETNKNNITELTSKIANNNRRQMILESARIRAVAGSNVGWDREGNEVIRFSNDDDGSRDDDVHDNGSPHDDEQHLYRPRPVEPRPVELRQDVLRTQDPPQGGGALTRVELNALDKIIKQHFDNGNIIRDTIIESIRQTMTRETKTGTQTFTTLDNDAPKKFFTEVYGNWDKMNKSSKQFYGHNVAVFAKYNDQILIHGHTLRQRLSKDRGWVQLIPDEIELLAKDFSSIAQTTRLQNFRVNMMKNKNGDGDSVLFCSNLPDIPDGSNVWYMNNDKKYVCIEDPPKDLLRQLYNMVYMDASTPATPHLTFTGNSPPSSSSWTMTQVTVSPVTTRNYLNLGLFTLDMLATDSPEKKETPPSDTDLDEYSWLWDGVNKHKWIYDKDTRGFYRLEDGKKIPYTDTEYSDENTCYTSYLGGGKKDGCKRVIQCITDGDPESLSRCLKVLGEMDLWKVAEDDIKKVGPRMILAVLRKFHVQKKTGDNQLMSYSEWVQQFEKKHKTEWETIRKNKNLLTYLKGMIETVRNNPCILNPDLPELTTGVDRTSEYAKSFPLRMRKFRDPSDTPFNTDVVVAQIHSFDPNYMRGLSPNWEDSIAYDAPGYLIGPMRGGAPNEPRAANMFQGMLRTITKYLADVNIKIHPDDYKKITNVIAKMKKYEDQLTNLFSIYRKVVNVLKFYGVSPKNTLYTRITEDLRITNLSNQQDIIKFLSKIIQDVRVTVNNNQSFQNHMSNDLILAIKLLINNAKSSPGTTDNPAKEEYEDL